MKSKDPLVQMLSGKKVESPAAPGKNYPGKSNGQRGFDNSAHKLEMLIKNYDRNTKQLVSRIHKVLLKTFHKVFLNYYKNGTVFQAKIV